MSYRERVKILPMAEFHTPTAGKVGDLRKSWPSSNRSVLLHDHNAQVGDINPAESQNGPSHHHLNDDCDKRQLRDGQGARAGRQRQMKITVAHRLHVHPLLNLSTRSE